MGAAVTIYALVDPRTATVRYVGQTRQRYLCRRLAQHVFDRGTTPKCAWIADLKQVGLRPDIVVLEVVGREDAVERERAWIDQLRADGVDLTNLYDPDLKRERPAVSCAKLAETRASMTGWKHSAATRAKIGRAAESNSQAKITRADVIEIRTACAGGTSQREMARRLGLHPQTVNDIVHKVTWRSV